MEKSFTYRGDNRTDQLSDTYGNYPFILALFYGSTEDDGLYLRDAGETLADIADYKILQNGIMKNETEDIAWISDGPYNYLGGNVNREYMYLGLEPASLTQDAIKTFEAAIDAAALPQSLHYFDMSILGDVLGTPEAGTLYIKAQPSYNFYVEQLEKFDETFGAGKKNPVGFRKLLRPSDYYAYNSIKIRGEDITKNEFAIKTFMEYATTPKSYNVKDRTALKWKPIPAGKLAGFYKPYLSLMSYIFDAATNNVTVSALPAVYSNSTYSNQYLQQFKENGPEGFMATKPNFTLNQPTSFISQDKILTDLTHGTEKMLPFSFVIESNYNLMPANTNNEFKRLLLDLNLYETFIYNLADRHDKPFFSITDGGEVDFQTISKNFAPDSSIISRAPLVAQTLKYALTNSGLIAPKDLPVKQAEKLTKLKDNVQTSFAAQLLVLGGAAAQPSIAAAALAAGKGAAAHTDFIYTEHNENTTVTDFDAFVLSARLQQFVNKNYKPMLIRMFRDLSAEDGEKTTPDKLRATPLKNYAEVLAYSVERFRVEIAKDPQGFIEESLQFEKEYILPASMDKKDIIKVVDAGVEYDTPYVYRFSCHVLSVGTGFATDDSYYAPNFNQWDYDAALVVSGISYPDLRIMKVPMWQSEKQYIMDSPPVYPTSLIIPSRQDPTRVKIVLSDNVGGVVDFPIPLFDKDKENLTKIYSKQFALPGASMAVGIVDELHALAAKSSLDEEIKILKAKLDWTRLKFDTKSPITKYQILRINTPPDDYVDFVDGKITTLNKAQGVGFEDTIEPNHDYYYCFRAINAHGYASNPSPILHLNVYADGDIHIGEVRPYVFPSELSPQPQIAPMYSNGIVSVSLSTEQYEADPPLNSANAKAMWEKMAYAASDNNRVEALDTSGNHYFKVRAKSRTSGRVMDLNFTPTVQKLDKIGSVGQQAAELMKSKGFSQGDLVELSNYFDLSTKAMKTLFNIEDEFGVNPALIQSIVEKIRNRKLDQQALQSILANFRQMKST